MATPVVHQRPTRRLREIRRRRRIILLSVSAVVLIGVVWGIRAISFADSMKVEDIVVDGSSRIDEKWIKIDADELMNTTWFGLLSRHNRYLVPQAGIERKVAARPEIKQVDVRVDGGVLIITVVEREAVATFCGPDGSCFLMDDTGVVFAPAIETTDDGLVTTSAFIVSAALSSTSTPNQTSRIRIVGAASEPVIIGDIALSAPHLTAARELVAQLTAFGVHADAVLLDSSEEITLTQASGPFVRAAWPTIDDARDNLATLVASGQLSTSSIATKEYIDLRFDDSVYFK